MRSQREIDREKRALLEEEGRQQRIIIAARRRSDVVSEQLVVLSLSDKIDADKITDRAEDEAWDQEKKDDVMHALEWLNGENDDAPSSAWIPTREVTEEHDEMRHALRKIIECNRREMEAKHGDPDLAELGVCVKICRDALKEPFVPKKDL